MLIATGGAPHSDTAVRLGGRLTAMMNGSVTLLTVVKHDNKRAQGAAILANAANLLPQEGITAVASKIRIGRAVDEIALEARQGAYNLVVVGSRPIHQLVKRMIGPVAQRVMLRAGCPVLIAKSEPTSLNRLLICESGREPSLLQRLMTHLPNLLQTGADITVLHVMSQIVAGPGIPEWQLYASAAELIAEHTPEGELLKNDVALLTESKNAPQVKIRHGLVVDEIVAEANSGDYDLVVIGTHIGSGWERLLLDDVSHAVVTQVNQALLVL
ncbi:MAG: universal stress protein [Chloroflexi bacterium]|nr:universal stress protein [Chloroflexota bacterium]